MRKYVSHCRRYFPRFSLAPNWRKLHRSYTVLLGLALTLLGAIQTFLPALQGVLTERRFALLTFVLGVVITVLRYVAQPSLNQEVSHGQE